MFKWFLKNEKLNSKIKLSNNPSFVILIFAILKFRNISYSTFCLSKFLTLTFTLWGSKTNIFSIYLTIKKICPTYKFFSIFSTIQVIPKNCWLFWSLKVCNFFIHYYRRIHLLKGISTWIFSRKFLPSWNAIWNNVYMS